MKIEVGLVRVPRASILGRVSDTVSTEKLSKKGLSAFFSSREWAERDSTTPRNAFHGGANSFHSTVSIPHYHFFCSFLFFPSQVFFRGARERKREGPFGEGGLPAEPCGEWRGGRREKSEINFTTCRVSPSFSDGAGFFFRVEAPVTFENLETISLSDRYRGKINTVFRGRAPGGRRKPENLFPTSFDLRGAQKATEPTKQWEEFAMDRPFRADLHAKLFAKCAV